MYITYSIYIFRDKTTKKIIVILIKTKKRKNNTTIKMSQKEHIDYKDILQIFAGSLAAAIVFAPNYEFREISQNLPIYKLIVIIAFTIIFSGLLAYWIGGRKLKIKQIRTIAFVIPLRVVLIYLISLLSCSVALWIYDVINLETKVIYIVREVILLSLPATWGGALLDLVYSKNK